MDLKYAFTSVANILGRRGESHAQPPQATLLHVKQCWTTQPLLASSLWKGASRFGSRKEAHRPRKTKKHFRGSQTACQRSLPVTLPRLLQNLQAQIRQDLQLRLLRAHPPTPIPAVGLEGSRGEKDSQGRVAAFQHCYTCNNVGLSVFNILPRGKFR